MTRKRSAYTPRPIRIPVMRELHDEIAMGLHVAYRALVNAPDESSFSMLARIFNMVGMAIEGDPRFKDEFRVINSGALAMNQIGAKPGPLRGLPIELLPVQNAVMAVDSLLPRLDVSKLHWANTRLQAA